MKRIRYYIKQDLLGFLLTSDYFEGTNGKIRIVLNTNDFAYFIEDEKGITLLTDLSKSLQMLKKKAKEAAISLGVKFEPEARPRINGKAQS